MSMDLLIAIAEEHQARTGHHYSTPRFDCNVCRHLKAAEREIEQERWREVESEHIVSKTTP